MEWIIAGILIVPIIMGVFIKVFLCRRLKEIEGICGVHRKQDNVIGSLGNENR